MTPNEIPEREVEHSFDDDEWADVSGTGAATTLDMSNQAKAAARRKREKVESQLGGFGFRGAA